MRSMSPRVGSLAVENDFNGLSINHHSGELRVFRAEDFICERITQILHFE